MRILLVLIIGAAGALGTRPGAARGTAKAAAVTPGHWVARDSQTASDIHAVTCPSAAVCYATAYQGTIVSTTDGGRTWTSLLSGATSGVWGITCPSVTTCVAGSERDFHILRSTDSGRTWDLAYQPDLATPDQSDGSETGPNFYHLGLYVATCPTARTCLLVGTVGHIYRTTDGGTSWTVRAGAYSDVPQATGTSRQSVLSDVSCPTTGVCYTVGFLCNCYPPYDVATGGEIAVSTDGGASWRSRTIANILQGVTCIAARACIAIGLNGTILRTTDGGRTWPAVPNPLTGGKTNLYAIACAGSVCRAVGGGANDRGGVLLRSADGGRTWRAESVPTTASLDAIACPRANLCYLGGAAGALLVGF